MKRAHDSRFGRVVNGLGPERKIRRSEAYRRTSDQMPNPANDSVEASHTGDLRSIPEWTGFVLYMTKDSLRYLDNPPVCWYTGTAG